ncbi:murein L,D-transpeptidase [Edaphobacter sp. 12200R-103]|uniref:L,D-transpeptidase family protein n=1 Tax=Edaphobacter sp. 12200R-103 TaxID=2703788 RepID=UPI00138D9204|nr:L,D-transpeptidase family protein [Edaphobacter sp. 12200R-103]QHS52514.1 L,D-transpeptidase family protein [Edaphobacter sp. 12200R-103]
MIKSALRSAGILSLLALLFTFSGCHRHRKTTSAPNTTDYSDDIQSLVAFSRLSFLRWPNISDYEPLVKTFYDDRNYEIAWTRDGKPTPAAQGFIKAFAEAADKGLNPEDYDNSRWPARIQSLSSGHEDVVAKFDVAMTVNVMRFISDLRIGRVNPQHFNFGIDVANKKYNLAEFISDHAVDITDVPKLLATVEPDSDNYRRTEDALTHYVELARQEPAGSAAQPLPTVTKSLSIGETYPAAGQLEQRLLLEGDIASSAESATQEKTDDAPHVITKRISEGLRAYQERHGLTIDGRLTSETVTSLNVPMSQRVAQLQYALERWRWLPDPYLNPRLLVNLPEFVLRAYSPDHNLEFKMKVVVGKVIGEHQTPVFARMMRYLVFRPYWNVPTSIVRKELIPHIQANHNYLESKNFEVYNNKGQTVSDYTVKQLAQGGLMVREKPGPRNSLGLVKFMFPNQYDIYLHSTPATELFNRTRRDFSHGCVRVQKPADLAAWLLDGQKDKDGKEWSLDKVQQAMNAGPNNYQVNLKTPIPIVIFYVTAEVEEDGHVHFFNDIYGYDESLRKTLEKGPPYPIRPDAVASRPKTDNTV